MSRIDKRIAAFGRVLFIAAAVLTIFPAATPAKPVYLPPTPDGWPGEYRDEMDIAEYEAFHRAKSLERQEAQATVPTPNQNLYDARFYDLDITLTPASSTLSGIVKIRAEITGGPLTQLDLDLKSNLIVDGVLSGGVAATSSRLADVLTVNLDRSYSNGEIVEVQVTYHGTPTGGYFGFSTAGGQPLIWSLSEPFGARTWWPCKDYSHDKADSADIRITVPTGLKTASNGTRVLNTDNGSIAVTKWQERYPIATYLISLASHPYTTSTDYYKYSMTDSMPILFYVVPAQVPVATPENAKVKTMLAAFKPLFGEYPFITEKYGHAQFPFGGGMEHQTCTSLGVYTEFVTAHELAHQWWGDMITCADFHHIWLNEGFASYSEALWAETQGGTAAYFADVNLSKYFGPGTIYVPDVNDVNRIFSSNLSYNKASWVLHMLRHVLGDATFFAALLEYRDQYEYSVATTENFRDVCESVSGKDLDKFFQQWIYGEFYPQYRYTWSSSPGGGGHDVTVTLEQVQTNQLFTMPVDVTITTTTGPVTFVVQDSAASQMFVLHVTDPPTDVEIDRDGWILKSIENPVTDPELDRAVLLVNGVDWANYGAEITTAYDDKAFWGDYNIDFWDAFATPAGGYPGTLPAPLGHGAVPTSVIGHYRNVIWIGNNFSGDLAAWQATPIQSYLEAGGNVLLMTRQGDLFVTGSLKTYIGINTWTSTSATLNDCVATVTGLTNMTNLGSQTINAVFDTVRTQADSDLLYKAVSGFSPERGLGILRRPVNGGTHRGNGGRFIFLSGRPYRRNHAQLAANVMVMLENYFFETIDASAVGDDVASGRPPELRLEAPFPNPMSSATTLRFTLPAAGAPEIAVFDAAGRRVRDLSPGVLAAGPHDVAWDGFDDRGRRAAAGVYWARVELGRETRVRKIVLAE